MAKQYGKRSLLAVLETVEEDVEADTEVEEHGPSKKARRE
jgi:hypothetical protein